MTLTSSANTISSDIGHSSIIVVLVGTENDTEICVS